MTFLNVTEIESALIGLNKTYPHLTQLFPLPNLTYERRLSHALLIRGNPTFHCRPALVFVSGAHAREWGGPDILVNLAADLLAAYSLHTGLGYGAKIFSPEEVRGIVNRTDVVVFPDINPDGRAYSMGVHPDWRKNRNPASSGGSSARIGVDINRNYDFLWDFQTKFSPAANPNTLGSADPGSLMFHGTGPFSEAESRNVRSLVDQFPMARYFVDVHSFSGDVLYPWGDDENQSTDPSKSFMVTAWDGKRGVSGDAYGEYHPTARLAAVKAAAAVIRDGINAVRNQGYLSKQAFWLKPYTYPTSGSSEDWAFAREFLNPRTGKLGGFCIEFKGNTFFPSWAEMEITILDVDAGLLNLCKYATPSPIQVFFCRIPPLWHGSADRFYTFWRWLFPPKSWGPYGTWTRTARRLERILERFSTRRRG